MVYSRSEKYMVYSRSDSKEFKDPQFFYLILLIKKNPNKNTNS